MLVGLEQAVADTRSMARTIGRSPTGTPGSATPGSPPSGAPPMRWARRDPDAVQRVYDDLEGVADSASSHAESALAVNLRNVLEALAPVAAAQPVRVRSHSR